MSDQLYPCGLCPNSPPHASPAALRGHFGNRYSHALTTEAYIKLFPDAAAYFSKKPAPIVVEIDIPAELQPLLPPRPIPVPGELLTPTQQMLSHLTESERTEYLAQYEDVFQQVDRDTAQIPLIESFCLDTIMLKRLRLDQMNPVKKTKAETESLADQITAIAKRISATMNFLGVSRSEKLKNREQIRSSPASLISGYLDEIERNTVEVLQTMLIEDNKAQALAADRVKTWILSVASDLEPEETDTNGERAIPDVEEIVRLAGLDL